GAIALASGVGCWVSSLPLHPVTSAELPKIAMLKEARRTAAEPRSPKRPASEKRLENEGDTDSTAETPREKFNPNDAEFAKREKIPPPTRAKAAVLLSERVSIP